MARPEHYAVMFGIYYDDDEDDDDKADDDDDAPEDVALRMTNHGELGPTRGVEH